MNLQEAIQSFSGHRGRHASLGADLPGVVAYIPDGWKEDFNLALDSLPQLMGAVRGRLAMDAQIALTTDPNSAVPALLTTLIDPNVFRILFAPNMAAIIFGEVKKGTWIDETAMFPVIEHAGEVSSYGDFNDNGHTSVNTNWPQRQAYLYQAIKEYGDRELERAGLARINWVTEQDVAAATVMNKYQNLTYFFGVSGLQNYGLLNDPNLSAALTPATKAAGGVKWINTSGQVVATANEIYSDIQSVFIQLVKQNLGLIDSKAKMVLAMSPTTATALTTTNTFNVNVEDLLKKNFPNMRVETAAQYGAITAANPQGNAAGELMQLIAESVDGQDTGYCSFNEKMRSFPIIRAMSSYRQKVIGGTWGTIIRMPIAIAQMVGL